MKFTWINEKNEQTVKKVLLEKGISQRLLSQVRRGEGSVLVDGISCKLSQKVLTKQQVSLILPQENNESVVAAKGELAVLYEDQNWLVINKPAGMTTVPGPSNRETTLVNYVKGYLIAKKEENTVPHIITRLDRFTSGIVLIAKNKIAQAMIDKVEPSNFEKKYLAIVEGKIKNTHDIIDAPIGRVGSNINRQVMPDGQRAITEYWLETQSDNYAAIKVKLHTGRTHQIRVHFSSIGHPLLGDELYGGDVTDLKRQALHASELCFVDPFTNQKIKISSALPQDMSVFLQ